MVWAIPPLLPQPLDFSDDDPTCIMPLLFRVTLPDDILREKSVEWGVISSWWYTGSSQSIYFDVLRHDFKCYVLELVIEPDLSNVFLYVRNSSQVFREDFHSSYQKFRQNSVCEDTLVSIAPYSNRTAYIYIRPKSSPSANGSKALYTVLLSGIPNIHSDSLCPASGKFATYSGINDHKIVVVDFLHTISDT